MVVYMDNNQEWVQMTMDEWVEINSRNESILREYLDENKHLTFTIHNEFFSVILNNNDKTQTISIGKKLLLYSHTCCGYKTYFIQMYSNTEVCVEDFQLQISKKLYCQIVNLLNKNNFKCEYNLDCEFSWHTFTIN